MFYLIFFLCFVTYRNVSQLKCVTFTAVCYASQQIVQGYQVCNLTEYARTKMKFGRYRYPWKAC